MKKYLSILIICILCLFGCSESPEPSTDTEPIDELLEEYINKPDILITPVREYGENTGYILMEEDLAVRIAYPEGTLTVLNQAIESWIAETVDYYQKEAAGSGANGESAELTADYSSYLTADRWVSVKITGLFDKPYLAHPVDIIATFHADLQTGRLLTLDDLLLPGGREKLQSIIIKDCNLETEYIDENLLDLWAFTSDGLEIILARGDYLPMSDGTVTLEYPYEGIKDILILDEPINPEEYITESDMMSEEPDPSSSGESVLPPVEGTTTPLSEGSILTPTEEPVTPPTELDPNKPMVALTFDDGPSKHTDRLLDIFAANGGKGTFFVVGNLIENRSDTVERIAVEGHQVAGHSWDHRQLTKLGVEEVTHQIMATRAKIYEATGADATVLRPPYGSVNEEVKNVCAQLGVTIVNWSMDTLDWKNKDADKIYNTIMTEVKDGDIILCHDLHGTTVDAMERVIPALIEQGYQLVTVSELISYGDKEITAGNVYTKR